mgnify:CR=1 FL=1
MNKAASLAAMAALALTSGCASLGVPPADRIARLPVVTFPEPPATSEFVLKLPAGQPIPTHVSITGSALASTARHTLDVTLPKDLYVYRDWVSDDGRTWRRSRSELSFRMALHLPSTEWPRAGELSLMIDRASAKR